MSVKTLWHHYVTSDLNLPKDDSRYRRVYLINTLSLLLISALFFYIFFNIFYTHLFLLAFIEIGTLIFAFIPIIILRKLHNVELAATLVTINLFLLMVVFIYTQKHHDYALAQAVFLPTFAIFLKGKKFGLIYSFIFISIVLYIASTGIDTWEPAPFTITSFTNLLTTYLFIIIMVYYFESSRKEAFACIQNASDREYQNNLKLHEKTILLDHANKELKVFKTDLESKVDDMLSEKNAQDQILVQQSKMAAMGEMMSSITHQWKQPLTTTSAIINNMKIEESMLEEPHENFLIAMDKIEYQLDFMNQTINDFSNFFKPKKVKESFNISASILNVIKLLQSQFSSKRIVIHTEFEDKALTILSFKNEFIQVILNLLTNAKDAIDERVLTGVLKQGQGEITLKLFTKESKIYITVEDNAGGISPKIIDDIFKPYFTTKDDDIGTGIGLYMSKIIIEESMQGSLSVSNGDRGAIFTIIL